MDADERVFCLETSSLTLQVHYSQSGANIKGTCTKTPVCLQNQYSFCVRTNGKVPVVSVLAITTWPHIGELKPYSANNHRLEELSFDADESYFVLVFTAMAISSDWCELRVRVAMPTSCSCTRRVCGVIISSLCGIRHVAGGIFQNVPEFDKDF